MSTTSRSPLVQGGVLVLLALLIAAFCLRRTSFPTFVHPKAARPAEGPAPAAPDFRDLAAGRVQGRSEPPSPPAGPTARAEAAPTEPRTVEIRGRLVDANGAAAPLAPVEAFVHDAARTMSRRRTESDERGEFRVACPEFSQVTLTAHRKGHGRAVCPLQVRDAAHTATQVTLALRVGIEFDGEVALPDGSPAAGATLRFHPLGAKSLDAAGAPLALNLINPSTADAAWDDQCRRELFLTDLELTCDALGRFRAHSLMSSTVYAVEVLREGRPGVVVDCYTRDLGGRKILQLPR